LTSYHWTICDILEIRSYSSPILPDMEEYCNSLLEKISIFLPPGPGRLWKFPKGSRWLLLLEPVARGKPLAEKDMSPPENLPAIKKKGLARDAG
jgi:hypothetical protein